MDVNIHIAGSDDPAVSINAFRVGGRLQRREQPRSGDDAAFDQHGAAPGDDATRRVDRAIPDHLHDALLGPGTPRWAARRADGPAGLPILRVA